MNRAFLNAMTAMSFYFAGLCVGDNYWIGVPSCLVVALWSLWMSEKRR